MRDVNYPLRVAYNSALSVLKYNDVPIPVFYQKAPDNIEDENYIVFGGITNNDTSSQYKADTSTSMRVTIHTFKEKYNDGAAADAIAGLVLMAIYPDRQTALELTDNLQCVTTKLSGDFTQNYNINNTREYVDRVLTFQHSIFHR